MMTNSRARPPSRLVGASNFRDLGGALVAPGLRVRRGRVFRSSELSTLTSEDLDTVRHLGIRLILDLRTDSERQLRPSKWPLDLNTDFIIASVIAGHGVGEDRMLGFLARDATVQRAREVMLETYQRLPERSAHWIGTLLRRLADGDSPALVHCTAGKDRTGFVCAVLQRAIGVPLEAVYADYMLTVDYVDVEVLAMIVDELLQQRIGCSVPRPILDVINSVKPEYLAAGLAAIDQQYGSFERYLVDCGVDAAVLTRLKEQLLEPVDTAP